MMALREYKRKRDFTHSPEPRGRSAKAGHIYCVQKHDASHLHYDLRLQLDGVLKSWAVPKGPSLDPAEKRLAVEVEDHPVDYATFEGVIPEGYGAGEVIVWDYGTWAPLKDPHQGLKKGHLDFEIQGEKLHGRWMLVRTNRGGSKPQWLLMKRRDDAAKPESDFVVTEQEKESVLSGRRLRRDANGTPRRRRKKKAVKKLGLPFVDPQLATLAKAPPAGRDWVHELKFDGYRTLCRIENGKARLFTRKGLDWTAKYRSIQKEAEKLPVANAWLDGEIVALDEKGRSDFQLLQESLKSGRAPLVYYVFDLLACNGEDLRDETLELRKDRLRKILSSGDQPHIRYSDHWDQRGNDVLAQACKLGLEGIVSKQRSGAYLSGRGTGWLKIKCVTGQEFVIIGYSPPKGSRSGFGALLLATRDKNGELIYAGHAGTGFKQKTILDLMKRFRPLRRAECPIDRKIPGAEDVQWLEPKLVAEIHFLNWTREGILRHASFHGLREDKPAEEVTKDQPVTPARKKSRPALSHPHKVLIPASGVTKKDVADYYEKIKKWILPHLKDRPLALVRCPDGIEKECFFQKNLHEMKPAGVFEEKVDGAKGKRENVIFINGVEGLIGLTQMGVLEIHVWGTHRKNFLKPDQIVFDLDPGPGVKWEQMADAALELKDILSRLKLKSFLKTTGGKGLHIHVPVTPKYDWDQIKAFAKALAQYMHQQRPSLYLANMAKSKRKGKIFIDYLRNGYGATAIAPYSTRARDRGAVAFPIGWNDIRKIGPADFTVKNAAEILSRRRSDPWKGYFRTRQQIPMEELEEADA